MTFLRRSLLAAALLTVSAPAFAQQGVGSNYETRLSSLEDEIRALNGQVEQLSFAIRRLDQNSQRMQSDVESRLTKLEVTVGTLSAASEARAANPVPSYPQQENTEGTLGGLRHRGGYVTGAINAPEAPPLPEVRVAATPQEQYEQAFALLRQGDYEGAGRAFKDFIDENPKSKMIDNAKYWHAETLYVRGSYSEAAVNFADSFQQNPRGQKAPDSLLKLALSLAAMKKPDDACTALSELKSKYPHASAAVKTRANETRSKLKCR